MKKLEIDKDYVNLEFESSDLAEFGKKKTLISYLAYPKKKLVHLFIQASSLDINFSKVLSLVVNNGIPKGYNCNLNIDLDGKASINTKIDSFGRVLI